MLELPTLPHRVPEPGYCGRFAPTPSGALHLGSLSTALAGFLQAKARHGRWRLRIDDLDPQRTVPGAADRILRTLERLGLHWDGPVLWQSRRTAYYQAALERLRAAGWLYPCTCSRRELASRPKAGSSTAAYPGICRNRAAVAPGLPQAWRIVTDGARIAFGDGLQGWVEQDLEREVGDFIVYRRDAVHAYHLATVVDDAEQGVTEVLRGVDLLDSTPRQIFLQQRLALPDKTYVHVPILVDLRGRKLSKQNLAPEAAVERPGQVLMRLLNWLGQRPPLELFAASPQEILNWAIANWDLERLRGIERIPVDPSPDLLRARGAAGTAP